MESVSDAVAASGAMKQTALGMQVSNFVLKKAVNIQAAGALQLVQGVTGTVPAANLPAHLGQNINTTA